MKFNIEAKNLKSFFDKITIARNSTFNKNYTDRGDRYSARDHMSNTIRIDTSSPYKIRLQYETLGVVVIESINAEVKSEGSAFMHCNQLELIMNTTKNNSIAFFDNTKDKLKINIRERGVEIDCSAVEYAVDYIEAKEPDSDFKMYQMKTNRLFDMAKNSGVFTSSEPTQYPLDKLFLRKIENVIEMTATNGRSMNLDQIIIGQSKGAFERGQPEKKINKKSIEFSIGLYPQLLIKLLGKMVSNEENEVKVGVEGEGKNNKSLHLKTDKSHIFFSAKEDDFFNVKSYATFEHKHQVTVGLNELKDIVGLVKKTGSRYDKDFQKIKFTFRKTEDHDHYIDVKYKHRNKGGVVIDDQIPCTIDMGLKNKKEKVLFNANLLLELLQTVSKNTRLVMQWSGEEAPVYFFIWKKDGSFEERCFLLMPVTDKDF